ncbi:MAG: hypothetical protein DMG21_06810 [Acidobacteria bacterium]|nr:MAG: hypothetical protein DMG21_06810 [Acidobacteriota bacterium]
MIETLLDRAREVYEGLPQEPPTFTQGDLKTEHFWIVPRGLTLIDFDTAHLADPALGIGKFLADLQFWFDTYGLSGIEQAEERFLAGYAQGVPSDRLVRARLFEALELVKISVRRVYLFECDWAARIQRLVSRAKTLLYELDEVRDKAGKHILLHQGTSRREVQYACSNDCSGGALARLPLPAARH